MNDYQPDLIKTVANAKINIGLFIKARRPDGYHDLETLFYPVQLADKMVFHKTDLPEPTIKLTGLPIPGTPDDNLCLKAWRLLKADFPQLTGIHIELHKRIPPGAGLGGGSSNAARTLKAIDSMFGLDLSARRLKAYGAKLGADVPFFIENRPMLAYGKGDELEEIDFTLPYFIKVVTPPFFSDTAEAYAGLNLEDCHTESSLAPFLELPVREWRNYLFNDFEPTVFRRFPELVKIKSDLYAEGAVYASLTGTGSAVYGIFDH
jgi:4-diphosphocytidyl-2-C-methyl-D-erythritol kinase